MSSSRLGKKRQADAILAQAPMHKEQIRGPHEFIAQIKELSEDRYSRDVLAIFMKPVSPDEKLASLHQQWYKVRKPSADELWKAKQVVTKATDKKTALKSYVTLKAAYDLVSEAQAPQPSLHIAKMLIDYAMLVSYDAVEKRYEDELQDLMLDHHDLFGRLVARLESRTTRPSQAQSESSVEQPLREFVEHLRVDPERLSAGPSWDEILGCDTAKQDIQAAIELPRLAPQLAESISAWRGILLHGPPGTGKTALALSTAAVFRDCSVYHVKASNLMDKWLGATERNVSALFKVAEETGPSLIVLDEVEALLGTRQSSESAEGTTYRLKGEFLSLMSTCKDVVVIGTTNLPWNIDEAFWRRFECHIHLGLPDRCVRFDMLKLRLGSLYHTIKDGDIKRLADASQGLSGDGIFNAIKAEAMRLFKQAIHSTHFRRFKFRGIDQYLACSATHPNAEAKKASELSGQLLVGPMTVEGLHDTLRNSVARSTVIQDSDRRHAKWAREQFHN